MICGIVGAECSHLSAIANHAPAGRADQESLIMRFRRWLANDTYSIDHWFLPVAKALIDTLSRQPLLIAIDGSVVGRGCIAIDGSVVGRGCIALMVSVIYHGRALPLCWVVVKGKKGHFPQSMHCALVSMLQPLIPTHAEVIVLGDGEFDGTDLQALMRQFGWQYVVRTASNVRMTVYGCEYTVDGSRMRRGVGRTTSLDHGSTVWSHQHSGVVGRRE